MRTAFVACAIPVALGLAGCTEEVPYCEVYPEDPTCECWIPTEDRLDTACECTRDPSTCPDGAVPGDGGRDAGVDAPVTGDGGPCPDGCEAPTALCDVALGRCVACLENSDCTDLAAPRCDTTDGTCQPCDDSSQCTGRVGTEVCATAGAAAGSCVQCTLDDATACSGNVCNARMGVCTTETPGDTPVCRPCVADAQCEPGMLCVDMMYGGSDVGSYCLWTIGAPSPGPAGDCTTARPYVQPMAGTESVDGMTATVCTLALTTCAAVSDFRTGGRGGTSCELDGDPDQCGLDGEDDAACVVFGASTNFCTLPCTSDVDCPDAPGPAYYACDSGPG